MVKVTAQMVKELRAATGAGPRDCKNILQETYGDVQKAIEMLKEKGMAKPAKKLVSGRPMKEGRIEMYQHFNNRLGVLVEVNCETDFVAATEGFQTFCRNIAIHVASSSASYVSRDDIPKELLEQKEAEQLKLAMDEGKPENIAQKIVEGRMKKFFDEEVLMEQEFIKDDSKTIADLLREIVAVVGENMKITRFARFELGETAPKEEVEE